MRVKEGDEGVRRGFGGEGRCVRIGRWDEEGMRNGRRGQKGMTRGGGVRRG